MSVPLVQLNYVPTTTIVPSPADIPKFVQYLTRLYEDLAYSINLRDFVFFTMPLSSAAQPIPNLALFGSFTILVSGETTGLPCLITTVCKNSSTLAGAYVPLNSQAGTVGDWSGATVTVQDGTPASDGSIPISITLVGAISPGNFNVRIVGTQ